MKAAAIFMFCILQSLNLRVTGVSFTLSWSLHPLKRVRGHIADMAFYLLRCCAVVLLAD